MSMKMFLLKFFFIISLMFIAVLYGMQLANEGIHRTKGYQDEEFNEAWSVTENEDGDMEVSMLGNDMGSHDLEKKREKLEEIKAFNFFAELGKKLAEGLNKASEKLIQFIANLF